MKDLLQTALTVITCLTIALLLTLFVLNSEAKAEYTTAKDHCMSTSGEYGYVMVENCIKAETKAINEMNTWWEANSGNEVAEKIADHCHATSMDYGWVMVQHCITAEVNAYNNIN